VVTKNIVLCDRKFEIEHVKEFPLNTAHITFAKDTGTNGPVNVLES